MLPREIHLSLFDVVLCLFSIDGYSLISAIVRIFFLCWFVISINYFILGDTFAE